MQQPTSFKFDEEDYQNRHYLNDDDVGGGEKEEQTQQQLGLGFSDDDNNFTFDDDDDHYFRLPPTTAANANVMVNEPLDNDNINHDKATTTTMHNNPPPPPPPPPPPSTRRFNSTTSNSATTTNRRRNRTSASANKHHNANSANNDRQQQQSTNTNNSNNNNKPTLEPYMARLEKFELFSTSQCYYLVACDKHSKEYRIMKMDRTLIERGGSSGGAGGGGSGSSKGGNNPVNTTSASSSKVTSSTTTTTLDDNYTNNEGDHTNGKSFSAQSSTIDNNSNQQQKGGGGYTNDIDNKRTKDTTKDYAKKKSTISIDGESTTTATSSAALSGNKHVNSTTTSTPTPDNNTNQQQQNQANANQSQQQQKSTSTFRNLSDFIYEDPAIYTQSEIRDILDMINDGNSSSMNNKKYSTNLGGGAGRSGNMNMKSGEVGRRRKGEGEFNVGGGGGGSKEYYNDSNTSNNNNTTSTGGGGGGGMNNPSTTNNTSSGTNNNNNSGGGGGGGGLKPICKAYGILGFIKFLDCYYLTLITKRAKVGTIGGNSIYTIKSTETFPLKPAERTKSSGGTTTSGPFGPGSLDSNNNSTNNAASLSSSTTAGTSGFTNDPSSMLLSMWNRGKRSVGLGLSNREIAELRYQGLYQVVDLTKNFFFSYTYDLTRSLQENFLGMTSRPFPPPPFKDMYAWNFFLTRELEECTHSITSFHWVLPVIHGAFIQRKLHDYGRSLNLMLLARRSRHFAGTRYLKRGVSDRGKVANDVEHEQIIHDESTSSEGVFSSYLQIRGSIPTFWTQESSVTMPKPPIVLNRVDPTYQATQAHFEDLLKRYGSPIIVVDLVKQSEKREREVIVGNEFRNAIDYINCHIDDDHKILYCALDYSHISKHRNLNVSSSLNDVATWSVNQTGFFCSNPQWKIMEGGSIEPFDNEEDSSSNKGASAEEGHRLSQKLGGILFFPMEQMGILRTNCIDCLDRTNVAQFSAGVEALGQQLVVMGIRSSPKLDPSSIIVRMLIDMYVEIGDQIALQYGGSEAHKKVQSSAGATSNIPGQLGKHKELLTSIRRYYSNAFTDRLKQDAMNLFLGYYLPSNNTTPLWELDNDYYLHNFHVNAGRGSLQTMKAYQSMFGVLEWSDLEGDSSQNHVHRRNESTGSSTSIADDLARIDRVKKRCSAQNSALSVWWKVAIQAYIQQRMWMTLGGNPSGSSLPSRFDRLYRPTELSHFDKVFSRPWATPSRLSHEDQHKSSLDDEGITGISPRKTTPKESKVTLFDERVQSSNKYMYPNSVEKKAEEEDHNGSYTSLRDYVSNHGYSSKSQSSLNQLIDAHTLPSNDDKPITWKGDTTLNYLGNLKEKRVPNPKYVDYASSSTMPRRSFQPGRREEFSACLNRVGVSIDSNDVQGIRKLAESAHICHELQSGPYRGLNQNESAVRVATTIHGYYNLLEEKVEEGELSYNEIHPPELLETLKQRDMYSVGVTESFYAGWKHMAKAEKSYNEIVDMSSIGYRRSDLTTDSSMKLYSSFFDQSSEISPLEQAYAIGERLPSDGKPLRRSTRPCEKVSGLDKDLRSFDEAGFILKAASKGVNVRKKSSSKSRGTNKDHIHVAESTQQPIPAGFEQINEDLFARKDNKFMVFNSAGMNTYVGAGADAWMSPPQPVTKMQKGLDVLAALK